jgi:hypothetical protein
VTAIKPCPFCGKKPSIEKWLCGTVCYQIRCQSTRCLVNPRTGFMPKEEAIEAWNQRSGAKKRKKVT